MKIEPNPAALEAMARAGYERDLQNLPAMFPAATWEQLGPTTREKWMNAAARILQPYLDALPSDTSLQEIRERAARPNALHGCSSDPCGSAVCQTARDRDTLLAHLQKPKPRSLQPAGVRAAAQYLFLRERKYHKPTPECMEPPQWEDLSETSTRHYTDIASGVLTTAYEITREAQPTAPPGADAILKILEHHNYRTHTTPHSMGYWIHCACGWHSTGQKPEGYDFTPEHHAHLAQELATLIEKENTP